MRLVLAAFAVVALALVAPGPAAAQTMDGCGHEPTIAALRDCVLHAGHGFIDNQGITDSLLAKLDAAQVALDRGQPGVAVSILQAAVQEVDAQAGTHIAAEHATHLTTHLRHVIAALSA